MADLGVQGMGVRTCLDPPEFKSSRPSPVDPPP